MKNFSKIFNSDIDYMRSRVTNSYLATSSGDDLIFIRNVVSNGQEIESSELEGSGLNGDPVRRPFGEFVFKSGPVGYVNRRALPAKYIVRKPKRRDWKIGFRSSQLMFFRNFDMTEISSKDFERMKVGFLDSLFYRYPNFHAALERDVSTAISHNFAVSPKTERVFYKGITAGKVDLTDGSIRFRKRYAYLKDEIKEVIGC